LLPCKSDCNASEFFDLGITSFTSLSSYLPFLQQSSSCYQKLSNYTNECLYQISNSTSFSNLENIFYPSLSNQSSLSLIQRNLNSFNITTIISDLITVNVTNSFSVSNFSSNWTEFFDAKWFTGIPDSGDITSVIGQISSMISSSLPSNNFQPMLNFSNIDANSILNVDCSPFQATDGKVLYKIENSTIQSIFSAFDPVFLKIYQLVNGPASKSYQFILQDGLNTSQQAEFVSNLNNTLGNLTVL
jgi:hypothetical protein